MALSQFADPVTSVLKKTVAPPLQAIHKEDQSFALEKWIQAHSDCPIIGINEFQLMFPKYEITVDEITVDGEASLVVAVMSSSETKQRIIAQLNGWASSIKNVFFSLDRYIPEVPVHMTWISPDERAHPPTYEGAQWRSLLSLNESIYREPGADWIFLVDDDTFINPHALNIFISTLNHNIPAVYGYTFMHPLWNREKCWLLGGGGMLVHRQAAVRMVPHIEDCWLVDQNYNDVTIGCTSIRAGVPLVHSELFSPENKNPMNNPIHLQTMITEHHISPQLQVAMFADLP